MTELFEMILHAPESKQHKISATFGRIKGEFFMTIYVLRRDKNGDAEAVEDSFSTFLEEDIKTRLKGWIDLITEEAKHDNERTG